MEEITEERRKALAATIRTISVEEMKALGEELFPFYEHPWRTAYFDFIRENSGASFYHATTKEGIHLLYCSEKDRGIWFLPGRGRGPLQAKGLAIMKQLATGAK